MSNTAFAWPARLTATLRCTGALALHSGRGRPGVDAALLTDQLGRPVLPGTSLGGALRAAAARRYGSDTADRLFGMVGDSEGGSSRVRVQDATFPSKDAPVPQVRTHVGLDRDRLAARDGALYTEEVWPRGLIFIARLDGHEEDLPYLVGALDELASPRGGLGAGACSVEIIELEAEGRQPSAAGLLAAARARWDGAGAAGDGRPLPVPEAAPAGTGPAGAVAWVALDLRLRCVEPLVTRVPLDSSHALGVDSMPFTAYCWTGSATVQRAALAGSSLRGVLRHRVERACHASGWQVPDPWAAADPAHPAAGLLGWVDGPEQAAAAAGHLHVDDALSDLTWPVPWTADVLDGGHLERRDRLSVDRLTASPFGSGKFDDVVVPAGTALSARVALAPPDGSPLPPREIGFLALALRDVLEGRVGVGGSSHSGYGTVGLVEGSVQWAGWDEGGRWYVRSETGPPGGELLWPDALRALAQPAWQQLRTS